jgi:hypothetical protein
MVLHLSFKRIRPFRRKLGLSKFVSNVVKEIVNTWDVLKQNIFAKNISKKLAF